MGNRQVPLQPQQPAESENINEAATSATNEEVRPVRKPAKRIDGPAYQAPTPIAEEEKPASLVRTVKMGTGAVRRDY